jgi:pimeloyl-ACP methyl ester carboxylesterase
VQPSFVARYSGRVRTIRRSVTNILVLLAGAYALIVLLVWWQQERLVFPGAGRGARPIDAPGAQVGELVGQGGRAFRIVEVAAAEPRAVLLWFVGNGEDLRSAAWRAHELAAHGVTVLSAEYPGYGGSAGDPGVAAILHNAEVVGRHAAQRAQALGVPLRLGGSSMGTFSAVHLAARGVGDRVLLLAPPTTLADAAGVGFWWLPVGALLRHRFDNLAAAPRVAMPALVVHGTDDTVVPDRLGRQLAAAFAGPTAFVPVRGAGHNDLTLGRSGSVGAQVGAFLRGEPLDDAFVKPHAPR